MPASLVSATRYYYATRAALQRPAECCRCGNAISDEERDGARVTFSEAGERAYWFCETCDAALRKELDEAPY